MRVLKSSALRDRTASDAIRRPLVLLVLAAALSACGESSALTSRPPTIVPETEAVFRVGSISGGSWETFSNIVGVQFDGHANLYVLDGTERRLTIIGPDGRFVRTIGEAGEGPGEFRSPLAMAVLPDGRVVVSDAGHRGLLLFGVDGIFVRSLSLGEGVAAPSQLLPHGDDAIVYVSRAMMMGFGGQGRMGRAGPGGGAAEMPADVPIHRLELAGDAEPRVIHRAWLPPRVQPRIDSDGGLTRMVRPIRAFEPQLHVAVLPDGGVVIADSTAYRLHVTRPGHTEVATIRRPFDPQPVTEKERDAEKARRLEELAGGGAGPVTMMGTAGGAGMPDQSQMRAMLEAQLENMLVWPEIQVVEQLGIDWKGRIWVQRFDGVGRAGPIEVLDQDGTPRAFVPADAFEIPAAFGPDGLAVWVERDELDVPFVRVARLIDIP